MRSPAAGAPLVGCGCRSCLQTYAHLTKLNGTATKDNTNTRQMLQL